MKNPTRARGRDDSPLRSSSDGSPDRVTYPRSRGSDASPHAPAPLRSVSD